MGFLDRLRKEPGMTDASDGDALILAQLRSAGADLTQPRHVVHYSYVPDERTAKAAASTIAEAGFETRVGEPLPGYDTWSVIAEATTIVDETTVGPNRAWFQRIAAEHGGEYDGWEAAATP